MGLLIAGLIIFLGCHSLTMNRPLRASLIATMGALPYKGVYSLVSLAGFVAIIYGFGDYRADGLIPIWEPPAFMRHITMLLVLIAFIMLAATYAPMSHIKATLKHPMLAAVKTWALAHLLVNGDLGGMLLFGAFLAYGVVDRIAVKKRALEEGGSAPARPSIMGDIIAVVVGSVGYGAMLMFHGALIGVAVLR
jgi:uncharacterized membrane protein